MSDGDRIYKNERQRDIQIAEDAILELDERSPMRSVLKKALNDLGHVRKVCAPQKPRCKSEYKLGLKWFKEWRRVKGLF